jgi:6-phosphogluconolactonase
MSEEAGMSGERRAVMVYVGTYTRHEAHVDGKGAGIYRFQLDLATGALSLVGMVEVHESPAFLTLDPSQRTLYAVNEVSDIDGAPGGAVSAFALDPAGGALRFLGRQPTGGPYPCHVSVDRRGAWVLVANYGSGSVAAFPILPAGDLGPAAAHLRHHGSSVNPARQEGPHAHSVILDPTNRYALVADLGIDRVKIYRLDPEHGVLTPNEPAEISVPPGAGARHLAFHPDGRTLYCLNELNATISVFRYTPEGGSLQPIQTVATLPGDYQATNHCAIVVVAPSGRFVYCSNRGHDSIAIFAVDPATGELTARGHISTQGRCPRNIAIDPTGRLLLAANQDSDTIVSFWIDAETGQLTPTGQIVHTPTPVCIVMLNPAL